MEGALDDPLRPALLVDQHTLLRPALAGRLGPIGHARRVERAADRQPLDPGALFDRQGLPGIVLDGGVVVEDVIERDAIGLLEANRAQHALAPGHVGHGLFSPGWHNHALPDIKVRSPGHIVPQRRSAGKTGPRLAAF